MSILSAPSILEMSVEDLEQIIAQAGQGPLTEEERKKLEALLQAYVTLSSTIRDKSASLRDLRALLSGKSCEKTKKVVAATGTDDAKKPSSAKDKKPAKGHGRNGAKDYPGAERITVPHDTLQAGDPCPDCTKGTLYAQEPATLIRFRGQAPLAATVYEKERLRCNLCGDIQTAPSPEGVGEAKYDPSSAAMIAVLKYGNGFPFNRLQKLQSGMGLPLPASTQWDIVSEAASHLAPAVLALCEHASNAEVLHNDDTHARIMEFAGRPPDDDEGIAKDRTGIFTSGIVAKNADHEIALYFTGRQHAGENLQRLLEQRIRSDPPIQMSDALSRNPPKNFETLLASCLAHGRRHFVNQAENFPEACRYVLEALAEVYRVDARAHDDGLSKEQRLTLHQTHSAPIMDDLHAWLEAQTDEKKVEPNSGLGRAIQYMRNHWSKLTLFLRQAGAPLDNNICERALKKAILHRKNALFFQTKNGAQVGDLYLSLIHTAELARADPFDYLTQLLTNKQRLAQDPSAWMPWNYREQLLHEE